MEGKMRFGSIVLLEFLPAWLALPRAERNEKVRRLQPVFERHDEVRVRWFDADALGRGYTDFAFFEFDDFEQYHFLWEEIRDSVLFTHPYVQMKDVILGIEEGFKRFESSSEGTSG